MESKFSEQELEDFLYRVTNGKTSEEDGWLTISLIIEIARLQGKVEGLQWGIEKHGA